MTGTASSFRRVCALASGGVGTVELAVREEGRFRRLYAVKRLRDVHRDDPDVREMFVDEARIAGLLRHPNVVSVLDVGEDADGPFLVMDYVEGVSAAALISRSAERGEMLPLQVCVRVAMEAAVGLHAAHELRDARGRPLDLVHRDVSPQNLLIGYDGITRVTDFGIAKAVGRSARTQTGILKGKFGYMSPEQLRFEEPDRRSDLFSLGIVLFELASGRRLYKNTDGMDGARRILNEPPPDLAELRDDVPPELVQLLFSMLSKDPAHRPADSQRVARALEHVLSDLVTEEGRVEVGEYVQRAFEEERREHEERVAGALASATGSIQLVHDGKQDRSPAELAAVPDGRRPSLWIAAAAVVALGAAGAAVWWSTAEPAGATEDDAVRVAEPAAAVPVEPLPGAPREEEAPEEHAPAADQATEQATEQATAQVVAQPEQSHEDAVHEAVREAVEEAPPAATPRRRPRRRRAPDRGSQGDGVPMWGWQ